MRSTTWPVSPGAIIGYRRNGTPVRLIAGGSEPLPQGDPPAGEPQAPAPPGAPPAAEPAPGAPPAGGPAPDGGGTAPQGGQPAAGTVEDLPPWAQKLIRETRSEAAANRTRAKDAADAVTAAEAARTAQVDAIAKALGLKPEEVTPEQLAAERDAATARADSAAAQARAAAVELAVFRAAAAAQADGSRLLDSRAFVATLDGLDPSADGFAGTVQERIAAAVEANPGWKLAPPAAPAPAGQQPPPLQPPAIPASGPQGSFTSAPPGPRQLTLEDAKGMSAKQVQDAINDGLFRDEGFGPKRALAR